MIDADNDIYLAVGVFRDVASRQVLQPRLHAHELARQQAAVRLSYSASHTGATLIQFAYK